MSGGTYYGQPTSGLRTPPSRTGHNYNYSLIKPISGIDHFQESICSRVVKIFNPKECYWELIQLMVRVGLELVISGFQVCIRRPNHSITLPPPCSSVKNCSNAKFLFSLVCSNVSIFGKETIQVKFAHSKISPLTNDLLIIALLSRLCYKQNNFVSVCDSRDAYKVACLGVTEGDWRALAMEALEVT